jgi:N-acetylglutamate synthase-like GNAT family acetyltransferase
MEWFKDNFCITTDKQKIDIAYVHQLLAQSYWAKNIPLSVVQQSVKGSLCFAVLHHQKTVGFARVITDEATFAYLADVFIDEQYRGRGLSKWLVQTILAYPSLQHLRRFMLATRDAHGLYSQFGFEPLSHPERWMQIHKPDAYKNNNQ